MPNKTLKEFLCECADAIREKTGETSKCCGNDIPNKIKEMNVETITLYIYGETMPAISSTGILLYKNKITKIICDPSVVTLPAVFIGGSANNNVKEVVLSENITTLGQQCFDSSPFLEKFSTTDGRENALPNGITEITVQCFGGNKFKSLALPSSLQKINARAFQYCSELTEITIPVTVTTVGAFAFQNCEKLKTVTFKGKPSTLVGSAFTNCLNITDIYVPWVEGAVSGAPWGATNATIHYNSTT